MEAKKHPVLVATLAGLGLVSLAGVAFAGLEYSAYSKFSDKLAKADRDAMTLLTKEPVALTKENLETANARLASLKAAEVAHRAELAGSAGKTFAKEFVGDAGELGSKIKKNVDDWRTAFRDASVTIVAAKPEDFAFGFSRYYQTGSNPPQRALNDIYRQTQVVDFLIRALLDSKVREELRLVGLDREPVEISDIRPGATGGRDEIAGLKDGTFNRAGLVRSEFYRVRFVAKTAVLRRFVNAVTDSGRALSVRGVEVGTPSPEMLANPAAAPGAIDPAALPAGFFGDATPTPTDAGAAPVAAESKPEVVLHDAPSDFTVTLEYIEPVVKTDAAKTDSSEGASAESANK